VGAYKFKNVPDNSIIELIEAGEGLGIFPAGG
jgi:hypothetical protein